MKYINGFPIPRWWVVLNHHWDWPRLANYLYRVRFGRWAPGMMDLMTSTTLHGLSSGRMAGWGGPPRRRLLPKPVLRVFGVVDP